MAWTYACTEPICARCIHRPPQTRPNACLNCLLRTIGWRPFFVILARIFLFLNTLMCMAIICLYSANKLCQHFKHFYEIWLGVGYAFTHHHSLRSHIGWSWKCLLMLTKALIHNWYFQSLVKEFDCCLWFCYRFNNVDKFCKHIVTCACLVD